MQRTVSTFLLAVALSLAPAVVHAQPGHDEIETLIEQLSSPDEAVREAAQRRLVEMGDKAREALEAQVRARAAALAALNQIDINRVASPTLVTLDLKNASVDDALAELFKQTGFTIAPQHESSWQQGSFARVTISCQDAPFWSVLRDIGGQAGFTLYGHSNTLTLTPTGQGGRSIMQYPAVDSGAFMVVVSSLQRTNVVDLATPDNIRRSLNMQVQVFPEPKVQIVRASHTPQLEEAVDEKGNSLLLEQSASRSPSFGNAAASWTVSLPLRHPDDAGQRIARIRGSFPVVVQTRTEAIEMEDINSGSDLNKSAGDYRIEVKDLQRSNENTWQLNVVVHSNGGELRNAYALLSRPNIVLLDREGREWGFSGSGGSSGSTNQATGRLNFTRRTPGATDPVGLRWEIPVASQEITVPFEFTDLPLP